MGQCGGCSDAIFTYIFSSWRAFGELLSILTNHAIQAKRAFINTWLVGTENVQRLVTPDNGLIRWICAVSFKDLFLFT